VGSLRSSDLWAGGCPRVAVWGKVVSEMHPKPQPNPASWLTEEATGNGRLYGNVGRLLEGQTLIHRMLARRAPLPDILAALARLVEDLAPGALCSVLLLDGQGRLRTGAAPSLPDDYNRAIDGLVPGPRVGSCGTAAHTGRRVVVPDVATDSLWADHRELALSHRLRACWSTPITPENGKVLGTFAVYYREPRRPTASELELVEWFGDLAAIVIESGRAEEEARARTGEVECLLALTRAVNSGRTVEEVLEGVFGSFRGVIPYDRMEYALLEEEGRVLRTCWVRATYRHPRLAEGFVYRRPDPIVSVRRERTEATIDNDLPAYAATRPEGNPTRLLVHEGIRAALSCPLVLRGQVVGYLFFASRTEGAYQTSHATLLDQVAAQIAGALEQRRLGEELRRRNRELEELQRARSTFLATVSHELRTPLTAVVGMAAEMRDRLEDFSTDELAEFAAVVAREATDVAGIVDDLLVLARVEVDDVTVVPEPVDVAQQVRRIITAGEGDAAAEIPITGEAPPAWADPLRVRQIVRNLLANARRYGGGRIEVRLGGSGSEVTVAVADDGPLIPESLQERMFEPYARGDDEGTRPGSVGLGLWVARHLARVMSGDLVYRHSGAESLFELRLPRAKPPVSESERACSRLGTGGRESTS